MPRVRPYRGGAQLSPPAFICGRPPVPPFRDAPFIGRAGRNFSCMFLTGSRWLSRFRGQWRDGRVAEGGGLLNRYTVKSRIGGSNPPLSAAVQDHATTGSPSETFCLCAFIHCWRHWRLRRYLHPTSCYKLAISRQTLKPRRLK